MTRVNATIGMEECPSSRGIKRKDGGKEKRKGSERKVGVEQRLDGGGVSTKAKDEG